MCRVLFHLDFFFFFEGEGWSEDMFFKSSQLGSVLFKGQKCIVCHMIKAPVPQEFLQHIIYGKERLLRTGCQISLGRCDAAITTESTGSNFAAFPLPSSPGASRTTSPASPFPSHVSCSRARVAPSILLLPFPGWPLPPHRAQGLPRGLPGGCGAPCPDNLQRGG